MSRVVKITALFIASCVVPALAIHAQQAPAVIAAEKSSAKAAPKISTAKTSSDPIQRIKDEGLKHSQVMATLSYLSDVIGPRLTGSPNLKRANEWTRDKLAAWGATNAHLEAWGPFGRGWSLKRFSAQVIEPQCIPLIGFPKAWSPGTDGTLVARVVYFDAKTEAEFAAYKGKLKGAIVLTSPLVEVAARWEPLAARKTDTELLALADAAEPTPRSGRRGGPGPRLAQAGNAGGGERNRAAIGAGATADGSNRTNGEQPRMGRYFSPEYQARRELERKKLLFLAGEQVALIADPSSQGDGGTLFVAAASVPGSSAPIPGQPATRRISAYDKDAPKIPPQVVLSKEHYNRLVRMCEQGETIKMAVELSVQFHDDDPMAYNTVADIPGTDLKDELVMLGGHLDSWHSATGATDNGAGVSVAMEAIRILQALNLKPRRTIRIGLWTGEEQGLLGSHAFVKQHFGKSPPNPWSEAPAGDAGGISKNDSDTTKPEFQKFSTYFNLDNGTGKIRGVYMQGNESVRPVFRKWLQPFREMGATTLTISNTGGTDHQSFDGIGLPGFQFIQDEIEYSTRTHHSNQDVFDRIQADDMKQASVIMAAFIYNAAMLDNKLPRKPAVSTQSPTRSPIPAAAAR